MRLFTRPALFIGLAMCVFACQTEQAEEPYAPDCTGDQVSFKDDITPIINTSCSYPNFCHGVGSSNDFGITYDTDDFDGFKTEALKDNFIGSIKHTAPYIQAPECNSGGGPKLADSTIIKIECWLADGALNN